MGRRSETTTSTEPAAVLQSVSTVLQLGLDDGDAAFFVAGEPKKFSAFAGAALLVLIGLAFHMITDFIDCVWMYSKCEECSAKEVFEGLL